METKDVVQSFIAGFALVVAGGSARIAIKTLKFNARTKSAEFLLSLHKAFFVEKEYRTVRDTIDNDSEACSAEVIRYVTEEPSEFTDFLNFFELITFLATQKTLKRSQVEALLGYYLQILTEKPMLRAYIMNQKKGFEHLAAFLRRREADRSNRS